MVLKLNRNGVLAVADALTQYLENAQDIDERDISPEEQNKLFEAEHLLEQINFELARMA